MGKKLMVLALAAVIAFGIFGMTACDVSLADYKATKSQALQDYAGTKGESNYSEDNWDVICKAVVDGKAAIMDATTKTAVTSAFNDAKMEIDAVEREDMNLEWTNDNAVYAFVKAGFESDILQDIEGAFETLNFQKVYVTEKNVNTWTPLVLLFILDESGTLSQQEFVDSLAQDTRINHASKSRDLPFETVDTRHIERAKDTIAVGETLTLEAKGSIDYYVQPFDFKGLLVKPTTTNKTYTVADFPVDLKSVEARDNGWLYLELATEGYFNLVKAIDVLSRLATVENTELDSSEVVFPPPPIWQITDRTIADFVNEVDMYNYNQPLVIIGVKNGTTTVSLDGVSCNITII